MKIGRKAIDIGLLVSIASLLIAIVSVFVAIQANMQSNRANRLASEANEIARESNQILLLDVSANVSPVRGTAVPPIFVYGCKYAPDDWNIYSLVDSSLRTFTPKVAPVGNV